MKKLLCALAALLLILCPGTALAEEENLIVNGGFSDVDGDVPEGRTRVMWLEDVGVGIMTVGPGG